MSIENETPAASLAIAVDNTIVDILYVAQPFADIFSNNVVILDVTDKIYSQDIGPGWTYNSETQEFSL